MFKTDLLDYGEEAGHVFVLVLSGFAKRPFFGFFGMVKYHPPMALNDGNLPYVSDVQGGH